MEVWQIKLVEVLILFLPLHIREQEVKDIFKPHRNGKMWSLKVTSSQETPFKGIYTCQTFREKVFLSFHPKVKDIYFLQSNDAKGPAKATQE